VGSLYQEFLPDNIHHQHGCIVAAEGCDRFPKQNRNRISLRVAQDILDAAVEEAIGDTIPAK